MSLDLHTLPPRIVLALLIWGESRGERVEGQIAVGCVVRNRAARSGYQWNAVCLAPKQFSCFNADDPNMPKIQQAADRLLADTPTPDLAQALWIADGVISAAVMDVTHGAQNYLVTDLLQSERAPSWAVNRPVLAKIGNHSFLTA